MITSPYGNRWCPYHGWEWHNGADIDAAYGSPVLAANSGTVIQAGWNGGYGISVMISHSDGITTLYGHMSDWNVTAGQTVSQGDIIVGAAAPAIPPGRTSITLCIRTDRPSML